MRCGRCCEASGGRAFVLFASHRALREAAEALRDGPWPLFVQGEAPRHVLLQRFRESGNGVLLGAASFREGVDVAGDALSVVVIDKLPFAAPDDPVFEARLDAVRRAGGNPFRDEQLPQAVIALKQGAGRLIRSETDRGVLVLCDPRLLGKSYGRVFLDSLPPLPRTRHIADVKRFFAAESPAHDRRCDRHETARLRNRHRSLFGRAVDRRRRARALRTRAAPPCRTGVAVGGGSCSPKPALREVAARCDRRRPRPRRVHRRAPGDRDRAGHRAGARSAGRAGVHAGRAGDARLAATASSPRSTRAWARSTSARSRAWRRHVVALGDEAVAKPDAVVIPEGDRGTASAPDSPQPTGVVGAPAGSTVVGRCAGAAACGRCRAPRGARVRARRGGRAGTRGTGLPAQQRRADAASSSRPCAHSRRSCGREASHAAHDAAGRRSVTGRPACRPA